MTLTLAQRLARCRTLLSLVESEDHYDNAQYLADAIHELAQAIALLGHIQED